MLERITRPMSVAEFFAWQERQAERYELVGGIPVRLTAGARNVHDDIVVNLLVALRRGGCRPLTGDGSVETLPGQIRRPDVGVDCGVRDPNALKAAEPRLVAEVLSPSTRDFDAFEKLAEYRNIESLEYILLVEPNAPEIMLWSRDASRAWVKERVASLDASLSLPSLATSLRLSDIYEGVVFPNRPRLVQDEPAGPAA
ncbi:Uma2 family endonuclease [Methylobacterium sp. BE186]|uniref:Uma2 family endonuclease n=1 Tax=Methylobacterium sp. BE186 TaxID=2817715 RepID=UPI002860E44C|nr:Uma2 family endonuclease [Methylobacterium sp. BE186]MDR7036458.1 Uma2 family endonuclease [Methylobacterium sp. BE186]